MSENVELIVGTIERLADKLGITVEQVAKIFITAQVSIGMVNLIAGVLVISTSILVGIILGRMIYHNEKNNGNMKDALSEGIIGGFFTGVVWVIITSVVAISILPSIYMIVAPEYMGIKDMIYTLRP